MFIYVKDVSLKKHFCSFFIWFYLCTVSNSFSKPQNWNWRSSTKWSLGICHFWKWGLLFQTHAQEPIRGKLVPLWRWPVRNCLDIFITLFFYAKISHYLPLLFHQSSHFVSVWFLPLEVSSAIGVNLPRHCIHLNMHWLLITVIIYLFFCAIFHWLSFYFPLSITIYKYSWIYLLCFHYIFLT